MSADVSEAVEALIGRALKRAPVMPNPNDRKLVYALVDALQEGAGALPASPSGGQGSSAAPIPTEPLEPLLAELERLALAATPGPYEYEVIPDDHDTNGIRVVSTGLLWESTFDIGKQYPTEVVGGSCCCCGTVGVNKEEDAAYIAAANPATVLKLIAAVRAREVGMEARQSRNEPQPSRSDILERIRAFDFRAHYTEAEYERLADDLEALAQPNQPRDREEG